MKTKFLYNLLVCVALLVCFANGAFGQVQSPFERIHSQIDSFKRDILLKETQKKPHCRNYMEMSNLYQDLMMIDSAFFYAEKGVFIAQKEKDAAAESRLWGLMGSSTYYTGDFEKGLPWVQKSLQIARNAKLDSMIVTRLNIVGLFYIETGRNKEAIPYYEEAINVYNRLPESKKSTYVKGDLYRIYANMGEAYENLDDYEKAIPLHQNSFEEAQKLKAYRAMAIAKIHMAECYKKLGNKKLVMPFLKEAVEYSTFAKDFDMLNQALIGFIDFHIDENDFVEGEKLFKSNLMLIQKDSNRISNKSKKNLYYIAHKLYKKQGNYQQALKYFEEANKIDKILYKKQSSFAIDVANVEYKMLEKEQQKTQAENAKSSLQVWFLWVSLIGLVVILGLVVVVFLKTREQLRQTKELAIVKQEKEKEIRETASNTQELERERIAKDLHDSVGTMLSLACLNVELYARSKQEDALHIALSTLQDTSQEVRRISHDLMPIALSKFGLVAALESLCVSIREPKISFSAIDMPEKISQNQEILLFRICQEAINNVIKYAKATEIFVQIQADESGTLLQIEDNGAGFDLETAQKGLGIKSMQSRAALLEGKLNIDSHVGMGTVITLECPVLIN